jgi:hypothetical protein
MRWREWLNYYIALDRGESDPRWKEIAFMGATYEAITLAWEHELYDQGQPLDFLMTHADCEGDIPAGVCGPLADALQDICDRRMPARALYDEKRPATERFIAGLRKAAARHQRVRFH